MAGFADKGMIRMIIRQRRGKQISALLLMTVILCCGCSNHSSWQKAKDRYVVGVVTKSNTSEYWMSVNSGMEAAAAKYDMDVMIEGDVEFLNTLSDLSSNVKIIKMENEEQGTCILELPDEIVDLSVNTQMANIRELLDNA